MKMTMLTITLMFAFSVTPTSAQGSNDVSSPYNTHALKKVVELLGVMKEDLAKENKVEEALYKEKSDHFDREEAQSKKIIKENKEKVDQLKSDLKEAEAFRAGKKRDLDTVANKIAKDDAELSAGRRGRKEEQALFAKNEATFMESLDQLSRAVTTLRKKAPAAAAAASSASLISIAQHLKKTLTESSDFSLNRMQQETLNNFMRSAFTLGHSSGGDLSAPSFIQEESTLQGDFQSNTGGLIGTLQQLQTKVQKEKAAQLRAEQAARKEFKTFESGLVTSLENGKKSKEDITTSISQSQQQSSQDEASLLEAQQIFKSESEHLEAISVEYRKESDEYKTSLAQRMDESMAVHQAQRILTQEVYAAYLKHTAHVEAVNERATRQGANPGGATSLLQLILAKQQAKAIPGPALTFLSMKSTVHLRSGEASDPFAKVKSMVKGMLTKLQDVQAKESKHAAFCDKEQAKTAVELERKTADVQKTKDRLEAISASLSETKTEIEETSKDLAEMTASTGEAEQLRIKEQKAAKFVISQYRDSAAGLRKALKVLKDYFEVKAESEEGRSNDQQQRSGLSTGVIGILEIAIDDFDKLYKEAKMGEDQAQADFQKLQDETEIRTAVFEKNVELKTGRKVKLEFDESTMQGDLKSYEKELANLHKYEDELKSSCTIKAPTYAEKKAKRESEVASLREALTALQ